MVMHALSMTLRSFQQLVLTREGAVVEDGSPVAALNVETIIAFSGYKRSSIRIRRAERHYCGFHDEGRAWHQEPS
jgi:ABC-type cobalamin/Fe3+-siderophores transport system ATPase subunit